VERLISLLGFVLIIGIAWLFSLSRKQFPWRVVFLSTGLQFVLAFVLLNTFAGEYLARRVLWLALHYYSFVERGAVAVMGERFHELPLLLQIVPSLLCTAALSALLYHAELLQTVVRWVASAMQRTFSLSGAESVASGASVLLGRVEPLFLIRPFLAGLTQSEFHAVLVSGFATMSLATLAAVHRMGFSELHLFTATLISAPAALLIAKVLVPETQICATLGRIDVPPPPHGENALDALVLGTVEGVKVAVRVIAVAVVLFVLLALADRVLVQLGAYFGYPARSPSSGWSLRNLLKFAFIPLAWLIGVPLKDCPAAGELLALRMVASEFTAYVQLQQWLRGDSGITLEPRTQVLLTYALCGFSSIVTAGMQLAAVGALAPERQGAVAALIWRALLGGTLACALTACVAGVLT
jgi:CNT family concentrative nucleoside transporter